MSRQTPTDNPNDLRWQNRVPSVYETLIKGFHAGMTVSEMVDHIGFPVDVPARMRKVKIGSFTPSMFDNEDDAPFWKTPVPQTFLSPEIQAAVNDEHVIDVQMGADFDVDPDNVTLETLARVAQTQYIGFQTRMGELTNQNLFDRLERLKDPAFYESLRNCPFVIKNNLHKMLPKQPPQFDISKQKFSVKSVKSAIGKAYERTGKPDNAEEFYTQPDKFGVFAITDLQRTTLKLSKTGKINRDTFLEDYTPVRNTLTVALLSGELGVVIGHGEHFEISDQVLHPGSEEAKDQFPAFKANGMITHAGPKGSYLLTPLEIQIQVMEDHLIEQTHKAYELYRDIKESMKKEGVSIYGTVAERKAMCENLNTVRIGMFNNALPADIQEMRAQHIESIDGKHNGNSDCEYMYFLNRYEMVGNSQQAMKRSIEVARNEFPEDEIDWRGAVTEFNPFQTNRPPALMRAMNDIIQTSPARVISITEAPDFEFPVRQKTPSARYH